MTTLAETIEAAEKQLASVDAALVAAETSVVEAVPSEPVKTVEGADKDPTLPDPDVIHEKYLDQGPTYLGPAAINGT